MQNERLIPDSSFFSFFLHNTDSSDLLKQIIDNFDIEVPPKVYEEIKCCKYFSEIKSFESKLHIFDVKLKPARILEPLFSKDQIEKGEHEVLVVGYFCYNMKIAFLMIIDDGDSRNFIKRNFSTLEPYMVWTASFIRDCCTKYKILNKGDTLDLLNKMGNSTFRIDRDSLNKLLLEVENE